jgi:hypothetical protein
MPFPAMQLVYPSFLRIQVAALPKNIAGQIVGAPAFLLSLDTLSDDLELPPAPLAGSKRIAAERNQAERRGALDRFARRIVSEVEIETADLALGDAAVRVVKSKVTACALLSSRHRREPRSSVKGPKPTSPPSPESVNDERPLPERAIRSGW